MTKFWASRNGPALLARPSMIGLKRFIGAGLAISTGGHLAIAALALLFFVAANSSASKPPEPDPSKPKPPDAMMIDIVPTDEAPRFEGTPADASASGTQTAVSSKSAAAQPPQPPVPAPPQPQPRPNPQRDARQAAEPQPAASAATLPPMIRSETGQPESAQPKTSEPDPVHAETAENATSVPPPPENNADQPDLSQTYAQLALVGGVLGGGIAAPPVGAPNVVHDFATAFLERVSSCSALPPGVDIGDKISISVHVSFNPDATLAALPVPNGRIASRKQAAMLQSATEALQRCQPYTMLPPEKYAEWKSLNLTFSPLNFSGH